MQRNRDHHQLDTVRTARESETAKPHKTGAMTIGRRAFLTGAAGLTLPLPSLEILSGKAFGATVAPRFYLSWHQGQGTQWNEFAIPGASPTDFKLGKITEPLAAFKDRMLFLRGVDNRIKDLATGDGHTTAQTTCLTCQPNGAGPSFDQVLSARIRKPGQRASLNLAAGPSGRIRYYAGANDKIESQGDPRKVLTSVFAMNGQSSTELARLTARRKSVLDAVKSNMSTFRTRLGKDDKQRLDAHSDKLRELETRYMQQNTVVCSSPTLKLPAAYNPGVDHAASAEANIEILAMAFACNLTPVGSIEFTDDHDPGVLSSFHPGFSDWHAQVHAGESQRNIGGLISGYRWYADLFAKLLTRFSQVTVDGNSLLDQTVIQWTCDFGYGAGHNGQCVQVALAGSLGANVKMGRMLSFIDPENVWDGSQWTLNNLYVTILKAFGQTDEMFGKVGPNTKMGAISGVLS